MATDQKKDENVFGVKIPAFKFNGHVCVKLEDVKDILAVIANWGLKFEQTGIVGGVWVAYSILEPEVFGELDMVIENEVPEPTEIDKYLARNPDPREPRH